LMGWDLYPLPPCLTAAQADLLLQLGANLASYFGP
jgi:hypothetical protein